MKKADKRPRVTAPSPPRSRHPAGGPWLDRAVGWWAVLGLGFVILGAQGWLAADPLGGFRWNEGLLSLATQAYTVADPLGCARLTLDDMAFVAASRTWSDLRRHLLDPADGQVVPLFRLLTHAIVRLSGRLSHLATLLSLAAYASLVGATASVGHLVAREDRRLSLSLAAMAGVGVSSVLEPAASVYAASRALWAGVAALAMLIMLQEWRARGGPWRLAAGLVAAAAAPLLGPGGLAAGLAGSAYLWADGRRRSRKADLLPILAAGLTAVAALATNPHPFNPLGGALLSARAVPEVLVLNNLGLDTRTTPSQGVVLVTALAVVWAWSRSVGARFWPRPNPLEAAGATLAVGALWLGFSATGGGSIDGVQAVPQIGAVLFAAGWWSGLRGTLRDPSEPPTGLTPPTHREALAVLALLLVLCVAETPRFRRLGQSRVYPLTPFEAKLLPTPMLHWWRTKYLAQELSVRQEQFLKRLDQAEARCRSRGIGREALRRAFGRVEVPGFSGRGGPADAIDLLAVPETGIEADPASLRSSVGDLLRVEPEPRPGWMPPDSPWPPREATR